MAPFAQKYAQKSPTLLRRLAWRYMHNMKLFIALTLGLLSNLATGAVCTKEAAFQKAIDEIKAQYPKLYKEKKPYEIYLEKNHWVILGYAQPTMRGGGAPEVSVNKKTCEVGRVYLAR